MEHLRSVLCEPKNERKRLETVPNTVSECTQVGPPDDFFTLKC